ncbi:hypothetical protein ACWEQL_40070 [Kitasatospora sp. NPDC004240]
MDHNDPAFGADDLDGEMGALFRTVLDQPTPALPPALLPQVRRRGGGLRRRRNLLAGGAAVTAVSLLATAGWMVGGGADGQRTAAAASATASSTTAAASAAPSAATPTTTPSQPDLATFRAPQRQRNAAGNQALLEYLRAHLPEEFADIVDGTKEMLPGHYIATRKDGAQVIVARDTFGNGIDRNAPNAACKPVTTANGTLGPNAEDCANRVLPDGTVAEVRHLTEPLSGRVAALGLLTPDGKPYSLTFLRVVTKPDALSPTVSLEQLLTLAGTPGLVAALRDGWHDGPES